MKFLLAICMIVVSSFAWAAEGNAPPPSAGNAVEGKVLEVKNVDNFTYLRLMTNAGETWAALVNAQVKKGDTVTIENAVVMQNFESKSLKRTFKTILFGNLAGANKGAVSSPALGASFAINPGKKLDKINEAPISIPKASGANVMTVAEIVTKVAELKGKPVVVRGQVVKYNQEIMGKNWIHLRDGSGSEADNTNDILVTTTGKANVGDVVTVKGIVNADQDFGAGYAYKVLIEKATLQK
jgi:hypothetical protein